MSWYRSLQSWPWAGPGNVELLDRPIASPPRVVILAVPHGFNESALRRNGAMPFGWRRTEDPHRQAWNEMDAEVGGIDERDSVEDPIQRVDSQHGERRLVTKPVQGQVLSDQEGRLYEKCNEQVRPLGRVIKGAHGKLFELVPRDESARERRNVDEECRGDADNDTNDALEEKPPSRKYVPIFPGKEIKRVVRFGEVKGLLLSQVMEPNRLRDEHRLLCRVEMFEVTHGQSMEFFASTLLSETGIAGQLQLLTEVMMHKLQLVEVLPRRAPVRQVETRQPGMLLSGDLVFRLILVKDPTSDPRPVHHNKSKMAAGSKEPADKVELRAEPVTHGTPLKTSIPERFLKPWEFQLSREEALYDMSAQRRHPSLLDRVRGWRRNSEDLKKWQALMIGKELDEQLWGVRPPTNAFHHSEVREWVQRILQQAGYNVGIMLPEWEVYWRRKGV